MLDYELPVPKPKAAHISINKTINGPAQKVCDQWLIPVFVGKWMFGVARGNEKIISLENKVRKGGRFLFKVTLNGKTIEYSGQYLQMDIPDRLEFSWVSSSYPDAESLINVQFQETAGKTRLKLTLRLDPRLRKYQDSIKSEWADRCTALAARFKK